MSSNTKLLKINIVTKMSFEVLDVSHYHVLDFVTIIGL